MATNPTILNTSKLGKTKEELPNGVQGSRDTVTIYWYYPDGTAVTLTSATITGVYQNISTETVYAADGVFAVTDGANGIFTWAYGAGDVGSSGNFLVQIKAVLADTTVIYSSKVPWSVEETLGAGIVAAGELVGVSVAESAWLTAADGTGNALTDYLLIASVLDEDDMVSDDDTYPPTQQSVKAYVDDNIVAAGALGGLSDVTVTGTPADNEVLAADGADGWLNQTAAEAGLSVTGRSLQVDLQVSTWLAPFLAAMSGGGLMISMFGLGLAEAYYAKHSVLIFVPFAGFLFFVILLVTTGFGYSAWRKKANGNGQ